ncbi:hypothetical protein DPMN_099319, partial [Dreissena polymorpha]
HVNGLSYGKSHHVKKSLQLFKKGMPFLLSTQSSEQEGLIQVFEGMIICGRSKNPFLPECAARGQERILRAPADDHTLVELLKDDLLKPTRTSHSKPALAQ